MIPAELTTPRPRKGRRPTHLGTCQICGKRFVVVEAVTPAVIRSHGYDTFRDSKALRVPCAGSGKQPLEFDTGETALTLRFLRKQLADLMERKAAMEAGTGPPPGLTGVNALKVRFAAATEIADLQRVRDSNLVQVRMDACNREIDLLTRLLTTRATTPSLHTATSLRHAGLPRIGDLFRKNDGRLYVVESTVPVPPIGKHGSRRPIRAPHYLCRCQADGTLHRFLQSTITRALNNQGGSLPKIGRPNE